MEIHCSYCDNIASIDASGLQPQIPDNSDLTGLVTEDEIIASRNGFPYKFEDVVQCIKDQLPMWEVNIEDDKGVELLRLTCEQHNAEKHISEILEEHEHLPLLPQNPPSELLEFLLLVEGHLKTVAQYCDNAYYSQQLAHDARQLYIKLTQPQALANEVGEDDEYLHVVI